MDQNNEYQMPELPPMEAARELRKIRSTIRRRNWKLVATSLVLTVAVLLGCLQFLVPAAEKLYWDPESCSYSPSRTDLELMLGAYSELFVPSYTVSRVQSTKTGFAAYDLALLCTDTKNSGTFSYYNASLIRGQLTVPGGLWQYAIPGSFSRAEAEAAEPNRNVRRVLEELPEYVMLRADITFPEDLPMFRIYMLQDLLCAKPDFYGSGIDWVAIRGCPEGETLYPLCGMKPFLQTSYAGNDTAVNAHYPDFRPEEISNLSLEQHFISLLRFLRDQAEGGTGILPESSGQERDYYGSVLDYVEQNGVHAYGCTVTATPKQLLYLLNEGTAINMTLLDAWIGFYN